MGRLELREKNQEEARRHFARAAELGTREPRALFDYAMSSRGRAGDQVAIAMFRRALELDPDFEEANYHLGFVLLRQNQYREAVEEFAKVRHVKPEDGFAYYRAVASACMQLRQREPARVAAERAQSFARSEEDKQSIRQLLAAIARLNR